MQMSVCAVQLQLTVTAKLILAVHSCREAEQKCSAFFLQEARRVRFAALLNYRMGLAATLYNQCVQIVEGKSGLGLGLLCTSVQVFLVRKLLELTNRV